MKGNKKAIIASMILAASVALMTSACTIELKNDGKVTVPTLSGETAVEKEKELNEEETSSPEISEEIPTEVPVEEPTEEPTKAPDVTEPEAAPETSEDITVPDNTENGPDYQKAIPPQYKEVLDYIYDGIVSGELEEVLNNEEAKYSIGSGMAEVVHYNTAEEALGKLFYVLMDLDNNGTDELLIMYHYDYDDIVFDYVLEFYTITNGQLDHIQTGWFRSCYYIQVDKSVFYYGSGGYASKYWQYLALDGNHFVVYDNYYTTNVIDGQIQDKIYIYRIPENGEDQFIGYLTDETGPTFDNMYVFEDRAYFKDYK